MFINRVAECKSFKRYRLTYDSNTFWIHFVFQLPFDFTWKMLKDTFNTCGKNDPSSVVCEYEINRYCWLLTIRPLLTLVLLLLQAWFSMLTSRWRTASPRAVVWFASTTLKPLSVSAGPWMAIGWMEEKLMLGLIGMHKRFICFTSDISFSLWCQNDLYHLNCPSA